MALIPIIYHGPISRLCPQLRESSFNDKGGGDEDIEGEAPKIFGHPKGGF